MLLAKLRLLRVEAKVGLLADHVGLMLLAVGYRLERDLLRLRLILLPVEGTPVDLLWHVTTLPADRRSPMATRLRRFLDTPDAVQAIHRADGSVPVSRFRPPVYVTLWS